MPVEDATAAVRIREAAIARFGRTGFERTSVREIASDAGVSPALDIHHWDLAWLHDWSPYSWAYAEDPISEGWVGMIWLLFAVAAALLVIGWVVFRRRDVAV